MAERERRPYVWCGGTRRIMMMVMDPHSRAGLRRDGLRSARRCRESAGRHTLRRTVRDRVVYAPTELDPSVVYASLMSAAPRHRAVLSLHGTTQYRCVLRSTMCIILFCERGT